MDQTEAREKENRPEDPKGSRIAVPMILGTVLNQRLVLTEVRRRNDGQLVISFCIEERRLDAIGNAAWDTVYDCDNLVVGPQDFSVPDTDITLQSFILTGFLHHAFKLAAEAEVR